MAWKRDNFTRRKREKTTGKQRNGLSSRNFHSVHGDVMQVTPQGTGCKAGFKSGEVQSHCKAPLVLYQKGLTSTFLRLLPCHSHTGHLPSAGLQVGGAPSSAPFAPPWGWGCVITPFQKASAQGLGLPWWEPSRGQHGIFEWSYLTKAGFDIRGDFSI